MDGGGDGAHSGPMHSTAPAKTFNVLSKQTLTCSAPVHESCCTFTVLSWPQILIVLAASTESEDQLESFDQKPTVPTHDTVPGGVGGGEAAAVQQSSPTPRGAASAFFAISTVALSRLTA